ALSYGLREISRLALSPYPEFRAALTCGLPMSHLPGDDVEVGLYQDPEGEGARVRFHGLVTCSSPWLCPVCSTALAERRGEALGRALAHFVGAGCYLAHAVLTVQHTRGEALAEVFSALSNAWRHMTKSRAFRPHWSGLGYARGIEVTLGPNGWHPHIHLALVIPPDRDPWAVEDALWEAWSDAVVAVGWAPSSRGGYSFDLAETEADAVEVGRYV
ncbi:protein rep, partial [Meiothermus cerbereus]|uniref:protein rep n=1 Tax=Meiothermus cerbereus TaxID=65552 RepID=UPI003EEB9787